MNIGLYQGAASLTALERWQDVVTQNITSSQVAGFRKRTVEFSGLPMGELQADPSRTKIDQGANPQAIFPKATTGINFTPGEASPTRHPLDVAIQGEGFLEVRMPDGSSGFTRTGQLQIQPDRTLATRDGYQVVSADGQPITLPKQGGDLLIKEDGTVRVGEAVVGKLSLVNFPQGTDFTGFSGGVYVPQGDAEPFRIENPVILQGHIEGSNVTPLREMVALVQIARAYEANQRVISSQDQTLARALETLG